MFYLLSQNVCFELNSLFRDWRISHLFHWCLRNYIAFFITPVNYSFCNFLLYVMDFCWSDMVTFVCRRSIITCWRKKSTKFRRSWKRNESNGYRSRLNLPCLDPVRLRAFPSGHSLTVRVIFCQPLTSLPHVSIYSDFNLFIYKINAFVFRW